MDYPFPGIASACPVCGHACGAIYRGYYRRWAVVPEAGFIGWVVVRTAFCRRLRRRFALFPDFLVSFRSFSRLALVWLTRLWRSKPTDGDAPADFLTRRIDRWFERLKREVYLPASTLYAQLRFIVRELRLGGSRLGLPPFDGQAACDLELLPLPLIEAAIAHLAFGLGASSRIDPPP
jgi:hypothetical protein